MVTLEKPVQMAEIVDAKSPQISGIFSFFDLLEKEDTPQKLSYQACKMQLRKAKEWLKGQHFEEGAQLLCFMSTACLVQ